MPAKAGIQVRNSAHGRESEDEGDGSAERSSPPPLRHASEGWHPECATAHTVGRVRMRATARRNGVAPPPPPSCQRRLASRCATAHTVGRVRMRATARRNGVAPLRHASEGWHPGARSAHGRESEDEGDSTAERSSPPPSCQRRLASRCATAHTVGRARLREPLARRSQPRQCPHSFTVAFPVAASLAFATALSSYGPHQRLSGKRLTFIPVP